MQETILSEVQEQYKQLHQKVPVHDYNFDHFKTKYLVRDGKRTAANHGIMPGELAPDFDLPTSDGGMLHLSHLRGKPVLLTFSSYT
jgi:cytochrome oxidase Cu insertion factor (SCO1/SenC/PrrC family)